MVKFQRLIFHHKTGLRNGKTKEFLEKENSRLDLLLIVDIYIVTSNTFKNQHPFVINLHVKKTDLFIYRTDCELDLPLISVPV